MSKQEKPLVLSILCNLAHRCQRDYQLKTVAVLGGKDLTLRKLCVCVCEMVFVGVTSHAQLQTLILIVSHCFLFLDLMERQVSWIRANYKLACTCCRKYNTVSASYYIMGVCWHWMHWQQTNSKVRAISKTTYWNLCSSKETSTESWMGGLDKEQGGGEQGHNWAW